MISREEIKHLAGLARLQVTESETEALQKDIGSILEYVGQVASVDATRTDMQSAHRNVMRDDVPYREGAMLLGKRVSLLKAFPVEEKGYNVVRKIIDKDE